MIWIVVKTCKTILDYSSNFASEKLVKKIQKYYFQMLLTFSIFRKIIQKRVFKNAPDDKLLIYAVLDAFKPCFHKNWFQLHHSKIWKKVKKYNFKTVRTFAFHFKVTSKQFSKIIVTEKSKKEKSETAIFKVSKHLLSTRSYLKAN